MKITYKFQGSHLAHFSGDIIEVGFEGLAYNNTTYRGNLMYKLSGVQPSEIRLSEYYYAGWVHEEKNHIALSDKLRASISKEVQQELRGQWKTIIAELCKAKQDKMEIELEKAQRKVERLLVARDKMRVITGE